MVVIVNPTEEVKKPVTRLGKRWFDGLAPGETIVVDEEAKVRAFLKHGCKIVPEKKPKKKAEPKEKVVKPKKKAKKKGVKK